MPVIKSAKKKLRQDKSRTARNKAVEDLMKKLLKKAKASPTTENIRLAVQATDKAAKKYIIHKNKAARVKSGLAKLTQVKTGEKATVVKETKAKTKAAKKATVKKSLSNKTKKAAKK